MGRPQTGKFFILGPHLARIIHIVKNFAAEQECRGIMDIADMEMLSKTTVPGGDTFSKTRKALQTNIQVPWDRENRGDPTTKLTRRVYDYTDYVLGLGINEYGQAGLKYLHYSGRGRNDTEPDHYDSHCDFPCDGSPHMRGSRVATMAMYW